MTAKKFFDGRENSDRLSQIVTGCPGCHGWLSQIVTGCPGCRGWLSQIVTGCPGCWG
jgi:nitrate reductase NapE component